MDGQKHLIQVLLITGSGAPPAELIGISLVEFPTPFADGFVRDDHPTDEQEFFHVAMAETEAKVEPDRMANDLSWETMMFIRIGRD
jgi:hypothetical protein